MAREKAIKGVRLEWFGDDLLTAVARGHEPAMWAAGQVLKREAVRRVPRRAGTLARSAYVQTDERIDHVKGARDRRRMFRKRGEGGALIAFAAYYANIFEDAGARAHAVPGKRGGKILKIEGVGYRRVTRHPGARPQPFLGPALDAVRERIVDEIVAELGGQIERALPK